MALWDYYVQECPGNERKIFRERTINDVKYTHYWNWKWWDFKKDHWVSFLNKEDAQSYLIVLRYKEWMSTNPE